MRSKCFYALVAVSLAGITGMPAMALGGDVLCGEGSQFWSQENPRIFGDPEAGDQYGSVLAWGDFNGDGHDDLAIGIPLEDYPGSTQDAGGVNVLYGTENGLSTTGSQFWSQDDPGIFGNPEEGDQFGSVLASGDFNGDGRDDLAIGIPLEDYPGSTTDAGGVSVLYGMASGLSSTGSQFWSQNDPDISGSPEAGDQYGSVLASGDFDGDGRDDLAVGVPHEDYPGSTADAGGFNVLYGTASGLSSAGSQFWSQDDPEIYGIPEAGDQYGSVLTSGDFNGDGDDDLAVGVPKEDYPGSTTDAGGVSVLYGCNRIDPWADAVVEYADLGEGDPENALGPPYPGQIPADWANYAVRINPGGYLVLDMGPGEEIPDVPGYDFYVEEVDEEDSTGFSDDPYEVWVSNDGATWHYLADGLGDTEFDIDGALPEARYVQLVGISIDCEIDAVEIRQYPVGWWRGNTHTHSTLSDGNQPPETVAAHYRSLGYDFLVLTDHGGVSDFEQYSDPGFLCINGEELTHSTNHTNGIGLTSTISAGTIQENVNAVLAQGGIPHVNHLSYSSLGADDLYPIENLRFMEVHNAVTSDFDEDEWDALLSMGKPIYGIASDDCHDLYAQSGLGWVVVQAPALTLENILDAMNAGEFYSSTGVILNDYSADGGRMIVDSRNGDLIEFIGQGGTVFSSVSGSYAEYVYQGTESYVRSRITNSVGEYAWCQPVFSPAPSWTLQQVASYASGTLSLSYTLGTPTTAFWGTYLILTTPSVQVIPLWGISLPPTASPTTIPLSFPFPSVGWAGLFTILHDGVAIQASDLDWVDTGA